ncbi:RAD52 family DNA repair protein [Arcobacter sp. KX21116]|uniref:Rad52/Rad22 family DNA repair protein n=1 Tax=Arcobacter iocasae TaxID=2906515 RepID=UPI0035D3EBE7
MFNDNQTKSLENELDSSRIKTREKGNINLSYLEGFDVIETANKIFGYGNWSYDISKLEQVSQETNQNQNFVVCYKAVVKVTVQNNDHSKAINREDVGFGTGIAKTLADSHENSAKEAITDALKRTLRSFGNQFGNSLYDKTRKHNNTTNPQKSQSSQNKIVEKQNNPKTQQSFDQYEYQSLYNLGLKIIEQNGFLLVVGDDIFSKKDSIKACGFRWDGNGKQWYKQIDQGAA